VVDVRNTNMKLWWNDTDCGKLKPLPVLLCPPKILHRMAWDQTQASVMRDKQLTA